MGEIDVRLKVVEKREPELYAALSALKSQHRPELVRRLASRSIESDKLLRSGLQVTAPAVASSPVATDQATQVNNSELVGAIMQASAGSMFAAE